MQDKRGHHSGRQFRPCSEDLCPVKPHFSLEFVHEPGVKHRTIYPALPAGVEHSYCQRCPVQAERLKRSTAGASATFAKKGSNLDAAWMKRLMARHGRTCGRCNTDAAPSMSIASANEITLPQIQRQEISPVNRLHTHLFQPL